MEKKMDKLKKAKGLRVLLLLGVLFLISCNQASVGTNEDGSDNDFPTQSHELVVNISEPIAPIQPTMYGIFFEDINFAADGGIYAEMVKNRSFEFEFPLMGWLQPASDRWSNNYESGYAAVINHAGDNPNSKYLNVKVNAETGYYIINEGFRGMGVKEGAKYDFTVDARQKSGSTNMFVELIDTSGNVLASESIVINGNSWKDYSVTLTPNKTEMKGQLRLRFEGKGVIDLDMVSLFPQDTWMGRPKGLRKDIVQLLADLDPGFLRFPGGCIVEGRNLARRYQWKKTVGDIEDRTNLVNRWNTEFAHRPTPDYYQSFGLGFFEYFQLSEDLGAEPLPILSCGMACQFNTGELVPMEELDPYVQDAIDLIEFANGDVNSPWGKLRAEMGHPEPFNMKYIGIGNEQWGEEYIKRHIVFDKAIKEKYPEIIVVAGSGPFPDGEMFEYGMEELKKLDAEIIDEHYYRPPQWFRENADRYDSYDRNGPIIFAGEYAAQSVAIASPDNKNNWDCALSEAAFMTGLERNAEVVQLTSYAPLMAHADGWQWTPDLLWFNNLESYGTPNYYVQKMYSNNRGTDVLKISDNGEVVKGQKGVYATAALDTDNNELVFKVVNTSSNAQNVSIDIEGSETNGSGKITTLKSNNNDAVNSFESPQNIFPVDTEFSYSGGKIGTELSPKSFVVIRVSK